MSFREDLLSQNLEIPYSLSVECLRNPLMIYGKNIPNRIGIAPLEGFDSSIDGSPTEYVYRRYLRFCEGGAGLIWFEACAISPEAKSNPYQMMLHDGNVDEFKKLISEMDKKSEVPTFKVLQLTHSGRVSKDNSWKPIPVSPKKYSNDNSQYASDELIENIIEDHIHAAKLAADAGFDAVDVKVCHGYFLSELLSAYEREGKYGGSFENRTRAIFEIVDGIKNQVGDRIGIAMRLNAFDSRPYPDGYGISKGDEKLKADLTETIRLCEMLRDRGVKLINISASSPDCHLFGDEPTDPKYKQYVSSCDLLMATKILRSKVKDVIFMCTGLSSFGANGGLVGSGGINEGWFDIAGFGRQALAYPSFANDLLVQNYMDEKKCCVNCNKCFDLMDPGHTRIGCIVRDKDEFYPVFAKHVLNR